MTSERERRRQAGIHTYESLFLDEPGTVSGAGGEFYLLEPVEGGVEVHVSTVELTIEQAHALQGLDEDGEVEFVVHDDGSVSAV